MKRSSWKSPLQYLNFSTTLLSSARKRLHSSANGSGVNDYKCTREYFPALPVVFCLLLHSAIIFSQPSVSPLFQRLAPQADQNIYDTKAWSFYAGSPVRATPLISGDWLYAGNAAGDFFSIHKKTGKQQWVYHTGAAIQSSAIEEKGKLFFSDNGQTVYALDRNSGKLVWKFTMGLKRSYPWRYDYYYSSPAIYDNKLFIGGDDGFFYALDPQSGKLLWKFKTAGIIRGTAAIYRQTVLFGDTEATLYALDMKNGSVHWQYKINGDTIRNEEYGFDRRAITSSPVVVGNKIIFGARDGYLYCNDAATGSNTWKVDHHVSWVISTVAVKDSIVVTGTSDGRFVQAVNLETGREIWKYRTTLPVWASPLIIGHYVYAGGFDGQLTCIDLLTGRRISQFRTEAKLLSSPVWSDGLLYTGCDDGYIYALSSHADTRQHEGTLQRYVYYEPGFNVYFRGNSDLLIRNYLRGNGYKVLGSDSLAYYISHAPPATSVFVFATCYFPSAITGKGANSPVRTYLDKGGKIVFPGINPLIYAIDEKTKQAVAFGEHAVDTILSLDYGPGDTRTFMGDMVSFPGEAGKKLGLPEFWSASLFISEKNVDLVLGKNENGQVSAFVKNYLNGGRLVQIWMDADKPSRLDAIIKAAEWNLDKL